MVAGLGIPDVALTYYWAEPVFFTELSVESEFFQNWCWPTGLLVWVQGQFSDGSRVLELVLAYWLVRLVSWGILGLMLTCW